MEVGEAKENFYDIEPRDLFTDPFVLFYESEKFSARTVLHDKYEKLLCFKGKLHINKERVVDTLHDISLVHDDILLFVFDDHLLINHLHRTETAVPFVPAQEHF